MRAIMKQNVIRLQWALFGELDSASIPGQGLKPMAAGSDVPKGTWEHSFVFSSQGLKPMAIEWIVPRGTLYYSPIGAADLGTRGFSLWLPNCNRKESPIGADDMDKLGFELRKFGWLGKRQRLIARGQGLKPDTANGQGLKPMAIDWIVPKGTLDYSPIGAADLGTRGFRLWLSNCNRKESPIGADDINKLGFQPQRKSKDKTWKQR
jgi:hypothetical protein